MKANDHYKALKAITVSNMTNIAETSVDSAISKSCGKNVAKNNHENHIES